MAIKLILLLMIIYLSSCNTKSNENRYETIPIQISYEQQSDSLAILDTLNKYEKYHYYKTDFMELGCGLCSFLYQGILNRQNFGIKTNCTDGTIVLYMKKDNKWIIVDSIDESIGWNFKTFITNDINGDNYKDVTLVDFDDYKRVVFTYNKQEKKFEHNKKYDRIK